MAEKFGMKYYETSAKTNEGIVEAFTDILSDLWVIFSFFRLLFFES